MLTHFETLEGGLEQAVSNALKECKDRSFREFFINKYPDAPTGSNKECKEQLYWLDHSYRDPMDEMCELFRAEFNRSTITFGKNAFFFRAILHFMETYAQRKAQ
jgi:hypothetical protein